MSAETGFYQLIASESINRQELTLDATDKPATVRPLRRFGRALLWLEPFWLVALAPSLLLRDFFWDSWLHPWLIGALFLFWPLRLLVDRQLAPPTKLNRPIYGLLLLIPVGIWAVADTERAWHAAGFLTLGITAYFACLNWPPMQQRPWLVALCIGLCGMALSAVGPDLLLRVPTEFILFSDEIARSKPVDIFGWGETVNPNILAGALLLPIPLFVALTIRTGWAKRRWLPLFLLLILLPMVATLILAQSRGSYLALTVALMVLFILRWPWSGVAMGVAFATVAIVLSVDGAVLFLGTFGSDGTVTSFSGRLEIWQSTLQALVDYALTGVGLGQFDLVVPAAYPSPIWNGRIPHAHNLFLQVGMDLGVPGMLLYAWLVIAALRIVVGIVRNDGYWDVETDNQAARDSQSSQRHSTKQRQRVHARRQASLRWALAAGTLAALVGMLVHGLVDAVTWGTKLAFLPWFFYALAALLVLQEGQVEKR